ncbi:hypothetical protein P3X46_002496 [Hevea brasiliensis]|uniref:SUN domain-containing protein n=1 Tax=Hevea brasiliensis TaxID=3981 RepID=A0ABQ9N362_HEVBR|nr:hypothetical protein P3X46_002496 [Hevea brasiliensis]
MSGSTVSITANPAARRRPLVVGETKTNNIDFLPNEAQINGGDLAINNVIGNDKLAASHSKDVSHHSIRGEAALERSSKDLAQVKRNNAMANSTVSPRRTRKVVAKPEKGRWQTVFSVFTKNFVLLLVLIGLVQMVRRLALKPGDYSTSGTQLGLSEFEARIAEVESFLKTTVKMIQVQVEVVDAKIENEVGGLRREMDKKIDAKSVFLESELRQLVARNEELEKSMGELKAVGWLSKEDFKKFYEELKKQQGSELGESNVSLDKIRTYAREIVEREIEKHAADGLGRGDYALASGGAMVVKHSEPYMAGKGSSWFLMSGRSGIHPDAVKMLKPSFGEPGQCFPLKGSRGFVQIRLRTAIISEAVTLEHVAKSVAYDRSSAPKDCRVSGWLQGNDIDLAIHIEKMFLLTEFTYDLDKSNAQTFAVLDSAASRVVDTVRLDFPNSGCGGVCQQSNMTQPSSVEKEVRTNNEK